MRSLTLQLCSPHSAASVVDFVEFLTCDPQECHHLLMQRLQTSDFLMRRPLGEREPHEAYPFEALEHPAHGRPIGGLLELVGNRLAGGGELRAEPGWVDDTGLR